MDVMVEAVACKTRDVKMKEEGRMRKEGRTREERVMERRMAGGKGDGKEGGEEDNGRKGRWKK